MTIIERGIGAPLILIPGLQGRWEYVELTVQEGKLIIQGERKREGKDGCYDTRSYGRFEQRISLPAGVDADKVEARLTNGVLMVTQPKAAEVVSLEPASIGEPAHTHGHAADHRH